MKILQINLREYIVLKHFFVKGDKNKYLQDNSMGKETATYIKT